MLFRNIVFYALLAGVVAGIAVSVAQSFQVVPIIKAAEAYERAAADETQVLIPSVQAAQHHAAGGEEAWAPKDGIERTAFTALSNSLTAIGFALLLIGAMMASLALGSSEAAMRRWWYGLAWGLGGYVVFWLAPAIGQPPEIPLQAAGALGARQSWWVLAVVCTAAGLAGLLFGRSPWRWAAPVLLIVPHLVGAPHPEGVMFPDQTPQAAAALELLARQFIGATAIANAVLWLALGLVSAWSVRRIHGAIGSGLTGQRDPEPFST
ncbi:MAG: CbtA family protein [Chromatiaceae bacterium]|nr:CbtA family protein [Chromatiaceae bacterium]